MKKHLPISMLFIALAILLGHSFVVHHHHEYEPFPTYTNQMHQHDHDHDHNHGKETDFDLTHLLSHLTLDVKDVTLTGNYNINISFQRQHVTSLAYINQSLSQENYWEYFRCKSPPFPLHFSQSQRFLPTGLRAPPEHLA